MSKTSALTGIRSRNRNLESAVQRYEHPNGRTILLVGTIHVAEEDHYVELQKIVNKAEADGYAIHHEGTIKLDNDPRTVSEIERSAIETVRDSLSRQYVFAPTFFDTGWVYQGNSALVPTGHWHNVDANQLDMVRLFGPANVSEIFSPATLEAQIAKARKSDTRWRIIRRTFIKGYLRSAHEDPPLLARIINYRKWRRLCRIKSQVTPAMFTWREHIAALAALDTKENVALLWHGHHFPGIGSILQRNGFQLVNTEWYIAVHGKEALKNAIPAATCEK